MRQFLNKLFRDFRTTGMPRGGRRAPRRTTLQVEGLEDRLVMSTAAPLAAGAAQPLFVRAPQQAASSTTPSFQATPNSGFSPAQIRTAYNINDSTATGAGQLIAIVDAYNDPNILSDLNAFDQQFGTTASGSTLSQQFGAASSFLTVYNQNGVFINPSNTSVPADSTGNWEVEESLDVEWAHAIAPGARIALVEANDNSNSNLNTAVASAAQLPGVSVVSMSWGSGESGGENSNDGIFTTPAGHHGITFLAATGDHSYGEYPAFSPNVVAVGGTTLKLNTDNTIQSETAWSTGSDSWDSTLGTGGGTSTQEGEPSYQQGFQSTGKRTIPDVSFDADPNTGVAVFDSFGGSAGVNGWAVIGGTSLATPAWGGLIAMANQQRVTAGLPTLNSTDPTQTQTMLYGLSSVAFHDIASGSITANGHTYKAGPGYDEVTGLGSPIANQVVDHLSNTLDLMGDQIPGYPDDTYAFGATASGGLQVTFDGGVPTSFAPGAIRVVNLNAGTGINNVTLNGLPAGVALNLVNTTPGHQDSVTIGTNETSLSNVAGTVTVNDSGGTTALAVYGTADSTGRTYQIQSYLVQVSGMPGVVHYSGDVNALTINGGSGNNTMNVWETAANAPLSINAGSGTNNVSVFQSRSAISITGSGTNYVTLGAEGSLAALAGPVNISNTSNANGVDGKSYVTLDDTGNVTGENYTITSSSIALSRGPTINLSSDVAGLTINDAAYEANSYTVESVLATDPVTINGDPLDVVSGPAAGQVTFNNQAHA